MANHNTTKKIMALLPGYGQMRPDAQSHLRSEVYAVIFRHSAEIKEEMMEKINELSRQLYIANKKNSDYLDL